MRQQQLVMVPPVVGEPRGARWAADAVVTVRGWAQGVSRRQPKQAQVDKPALGAYRRTTPTLFAVVRHKVWLALAAQGHRRAASELRVLAARWQSIDPDVAQSLRRAAEFNPNEEA